LGIARHAIDILVELAGTKLAARSRKLLREDVTVQANLGRAEALLRSGRAFPYGALEEAWQVVSEGSALSLAQRATLWLASTHAANTAKEATELMFSAGGSASPYVSSGLERCVRYPCGRPAPHCSTSQLSDGWSGVFGLGHAIDPFAVHG
jgi:alkylation response protein AidB-like acyl-CoA dehydrogenase